MTSKDYKDQYLIGRKPILEALEQDVQIERVWMDKQIRGEAEKDLRYHCRQRGVHLQAVPRQKLNALTKSSSHQGFVALVSPIRFYDPLDILNQAFDQGRQCKFMALDGIEDTRNLGAIARTAYWFGYDAMLIPTKGSAGIHAGTMKSSAGALMHIPVCKSVDLRDSLRDLKNSGCIIYGADMSGDQITSLTPPSQPYVIVMGGEEKGISNRVQAVCDQLISIKGSGNIDSLNVSVAAGILMHGVYGGE